MSKYKGTVLVMIRKLLQAEGAEFEKTVLDQITLAEKENYIKAHVVYWMTEYDDIPEDKSLMVVAAKALYPNDPQPLRRLGNVSSNMAINGIYKILFRIPTPYFVFKRASSFWTTYNDTGAAYIENYIKNGKYFSFDFVVRKFPNLKPYVREFLAGYITAIFEWIGAQQIEVTVLDNYSEASGWRWQAKARL